MEEQHSPTARKRAIIATLVLIPIAIVLFFSLIWRTRPVSSLGKPTPPASRSPLRQPADGSGGHTSIRVLKQEKPAFRSLAIFGVYQTQPTS